MRRCMIRPPVSASHTLTKPVLDAEEINLPLGDQSIRAIKSGSRGNVRKIWAPGPFLSFPLLGIWASQFSWNKLSRTV